MYILTKCKVYPKRDLHTNTHTQTLLSKIEHIQTPPLLTLQNMPNQHQQTRLPENWSDYHKRMCRRVCRAAQLAPRNNNNNNSRSTKPHTPPLPYPTSSTQLQPQSEAAVNLSMAAHKLNII